MASNKAPIPNVLRNKIIQESDPTDRFTLQDLIKERQKIKTRTREDVSFLKKSFQQLIKIDALKKSSDFEEKINFQNKSKLLL